METLDVHVSGMDRSITESKSRACAACLLLSYSPSSHLSVFRLTRNHFKIILPPARYSLPHSSQSHVSCLTQEQILALSSLRNYQQPKKRVLPEDSGPTLEERTCKMLRTSEKVMKDDVLESLSEEETQRNLVADIDRMRMTIIIFS